ncbi:MAG: 3-keto-5-aminohexanoate cleavage protein, partial [Vallitaleaceae bacterium]|nr:3-keto-5-aminohexanoate cleavage protein [Vallitaleaceae bacterium]
MERKVIISLAPVKAGVCIDYEKLAEDVAACVRLGATVCHLHARSEDGSLSPDDSYMRKCFEAILEKEEVIVQASTGGVSDMTIQERCNPLNYKKVESASLNGGSTNLGSLLYKNTLEEIVFCAKQTYERGILPEIEVFDIGMIQNILTIQKNKEAEFKNPLMFNLVFGHRGGMQATMESLIAMRQFVPQNALWGVTHYGRDNWHFLAAAIAMGASLVRIGFEDSDYLDEQRTAATNVDVVKR